MQGLVGFAAVLQFATSKWSERLPLRSRWFLPSRSLSLSLPRGDLSLRVTWLFPLERPLDFAVAAAKAFLTCFFLPPLEPRIFGLPSSSCSSSKRCLFFSLMFLAISSFVRCSRPCPSHRPPFLAHAADDAERERSVQRHLMHTRHRPQRQNRR